MEPNDLDCLRERRYGPDVRAGHPRNTAPGPSKQFQDRFDRRLLYFEGRFIQILEGPEDEVRARFAAISADPRHRSIHLVSEDPIMQRQFPDWTMGFRPTSPELVKEIPGWDDFFDGRKGDVRIRHADNSAQQFLEWLTEYWFAPTARG